MLQRLRSVALSFFALGAVSVAAAWQTGQRDDKFNEVIAPLRTAGPRFWKGNLHTHSLWSDGDDYPEMIADWYKQHRYDFLALTDHNILADGDRWVDSTAKPTGAEALAKYRARFGDRWVEQRTRDGKAQVRLKPLAEFRSLLEEPARFMLMPAEEVSHRFAKNPVHMNAVNLRDVVKPIDGASVAETISINHRLIAEQRRRTGWQTVTFLNHPNFGWGVRAEDMIPVDELRAFEVFNGHPGVRNYGDDLHADCERVWDVVLALRLGKHRLPIVYGLATDDAHGYHAFGLGKVNPGRGWVMVRAPYLSAEAVARGLEQGDFYSSTGVTFTDVRREGDKFTLTIQPEQGVKYHTQFIATMRDTPWESEPRTDASGKAVEVTRKYSAEIGKVIAESDVLEPTYRITGKELYVRAKVISTKPHPNPYQKGDMEVAWTQPVVP